MKNDNNLTVRINMDIIEQFDKDEMLVISGGLKIFGIDILCNKGDLNISCPTTNAVAQCGCPSTGTGGDPTIQEPGPEK